jgi:AcrR family transcriptional regulator
MATALTTERILDAAERLFFSDGIAVTGVDRVADTAGVAIATLYKHVGSKDGLLEAVLDRRLRSWTEHWDEALDAAASPDDRLLAVFGAVSTYRASAGPIQWCCFLATASERPLTEAASGGSEPDAVRALLDEDTRLVTERLRTLAAEAGMADPVTVADELVLLYNGALGSLLRGAPSDPLVVAQRLASAVVAAARRSTSGRT